MKTRGTPVTRESFFAWKVKFDKEMATKRAKEQEEKLKNLTPKERDEYRKFQGRLTGTIVSLELSRWLLKRFKANKYSNAVETGQRMNPLRRMEPPLMSPNTASVLAKVRRRTKGIVSISVIATRENEHLGGRQQGVGTCKLGLDAQYYRHDY